MHSSTSAETERIRTVSFVTNVCFGRCGTLSLALLGPDHEHHLVGRVVKASASRAEDLILAVGMIFFLGVDRGEGGGGYSSVSW